MLSDAPDSARGEQAPNPIRTSRVTDTPALRKARGAFFTPTEMSQFIANWALRSATDRVLEPSAGEASFLIAAAERLRSLRKRTSQTDLFDSQLHGVEVHEYSARTATDALQSRGFGGTIEVADFFDVTPAPIYDAVIGNPPYIRYQEFNGAARAKGLATALSQGVRLTGLASSWAAFTVHATQFLKPEGRLGLVLPAELLTVNYAASVRQFLMQRFARVRLVLFEERVFPGVLEEVVLLLADGNGSTDHFEVFQAESLNDLRKIERDGTWTPFAPEADGKWTPALLDDEALDTYHTLAESGEFEPLLSWGETYLGSVTGNNRYFSLTTEQVRLLGLNERELRRISPPGSRHLRGLTFSESAWKQLAKEGGAVYLFTPKADSLSNEAQRYIESGETTSVHTAYKCRMRKPWYRVPLVPVPDLLLTYMDHERPRFVTNDAGVNHLNSLYGVQFSPERQRLGRELLPLALLNSASLLSAEIVGRAYGGGLLKLEPKEADKLLVPSFALLAEVAHELRGIRGQVGKLLRKGDLSAASKLVDRVILTKKLGLTPELVRKLRDARSVLFTRRATRGKSQRDR